MEQNAVIVNIIELLIFTITAALSIAVWVQSHAPEWILISFGVIAGFVSFVISILSGYGLLPLYRVPEGILLIINAGLIIIPLLFFSAAFIVYVSRRSK